MTLEVELEGLPKVAKAIIERLEESKVVAFYGQMGAGKTTLIREICSQMGVKSGVASPTFALVNEYHTPKGESIYHFDFYRINKIEEAYDLGYDDYFYSGNVCLVEWPEKIEELIDDNVLIVKIEVVGDSRRKFTIDVA